MANISNGPIKEQEQCLSNLTVENVSKLEMEYETFDGERRRVEDYVRKNQQLEELKKNTGLPSPETQREPNTTVDDLHEYADENGTQTQVVTNHYRKETSSKSKKSQMTNIRKFSCKNVQTQTECNRHYATTISVNAENPEPDDSNTKMSTSKAAECSVIIENTVESGTSDFEHDGAEALKQSCKDEPLTEMEAAPTVCEFCHLPKKTFPTIEQLTSEPGSMLFCCVKIQKLFQYMIMDTIESYTPEKTEEETEDEQTPAHISDEMKALCELREQIKKTDTKKYIDYLANHLRTHGSLFLMEKITFTLASAHETVANYRNLNDTFSDPAHNIDDYFIPIMDNEILQEPKVTVKQRYNSGQDFVIHFSDGTGQVLYPSGNIGILIACSKPTQFIFIILEDAEKPQIQAVFMSNGHAACYHLNGTLWTVLDPCGGSYFDENGAQKKHWTWWDFSQHVHAPPFQPLTFMLNSNIEVKILKQDEVYLSFTKEKEKVTFNVGSKLLLKNPERFYTIKWSTDEIQLYCSSKKLELFRLLNKIRKLVRISAMSTDNEDMIQDYVYQLQKSLNFITALISKKENTSNVFRTKEIQKIETAKKKPCSQFSSTLSSRTDIDNTAVRMKAPTQTSNRPKKTAKLR